MSKRQMQQALNTFNDDFEQKKNEMPLRKLRGKKSVISKFCIRSCRSIIIRCLDTAQAGKQQSDSFWKNMKKQLFPLRQDISYKDVKTLVQKLCRPVHELELWRIITSRSNDEVIKKSLPEYKTYRKSRYYLRYYCLNADETARPVQPYPEDESDADDSDDIEDNTGYVQENDRQIKIEPAEMDDEADVIDLTSD